MSRFDEPATPLLVERAARQTIDRHRDEGDTNYVPHRCWTCRDSPPGECEQLAWAEKELPEYRPRDT